MYVISLFVKCRVRVELVVFGIKGLYHNFLSSTTQKSSQIYGKLSEYLKKYEEKYRFSSEEDDDLKKAYLDGEGNMNFILDSVLCCTVEDDDRFAEKIEKWIKDGDVPKFSAFKKSMSKAAKAKRGANSSREAAEAEQHAADLGLTGGTNGSEDALRMMIAKRQEKRAQESNNFLDALAAKYAKPEKKAKTGNKKK